MPIEEGRPSRWRDGLARSFVHGSTHHCWREKGSKLLARGALGPFALGVGSFSPRAPETVQMERRMAWRIWCVPNQTTNPGHFWDCWSRGQKVSLLLGSARLDRRLSWTPPISMHSVLYLEGTKSSALRRIALLMASTRMLGWLAVTGNCKRWELAGSTGSSFSGEEAVQSYGLPQHWCASFSHCHWLIWTALNPQQEWKCLRKFSRMDLPSNGGAISIGRCVCLRLSSPALT